jgi:hypothetical protein
LCLDGVYVEDGDALRFEPAPAPTRSELESMLRSIYVRVMKWLAKRGLLRDDEGSNAPAELSPAEALTTLGMQRGTLAAMREGANGGRRWGARSSSATAARNGGGGPRTGGQRRPRPHRRHQ